MDSPLLFPALLVVLFAAVIYLNNKQHALWASIVDKVTGRPLPAPAKTVVATVVRPDGTTVITFSDGSTTAVTPGVTGAIGVGDFSAVAPVALDPAKAPTMSAYDINNWGFARYLANLTADALAKWQSDYVAAAPAGVQNVWSPALGKAVAISDAAQANLILLWSLGAKGLVTSDAPPSA